MATTRRPLIIKYWPEENYNGQSAWRLSFDDNSPGRLPRTFDLMRRFRQITFGETLRVIKRSPQYAILRMPARLPKHVRDSLLLSFNRQRG